ncbi:aminotransferase class V-fold PLP-dependent enzyme [Piscirickettsia litoralis]|uniref:aminotransferase class V-fold PLP-dependent enzyme n=1 Tax=Piscirickettsia litoralis TaxID=1891921 RepID=UPI0022862FA3|nr:aminotransferase class V-fold PLP-dependent enzyme [Piscirickettsia litoralis]
MSLSQWLEAINNKTQAVLITHVNYQNSEIQEKIPDIIAAARKHHAYTIIDCAQSIGVIPIDLSHWQADIVLGSSVKWLCGGPGAGFLWCHPEILPKLKPLDIGWFSSADPANFSNQFNYHPNTQRFLGGTPSILPFAIAAASIKMITELNINDIYQHNQVLLDQLKTKLASLPCTINHHAKGGTACLDFKENNVNILNQLKSHNIFADYRPQSGIRLSPHIYNTEKQISKLIDKFSFIF